MSSATRFYWKNRDYKPLFNILKNSVGKKRADDIFILAGIEFDHIKLDFSVIPAGERKHTDNYIFPRVALYRLLCTEFDKDAALLMIDDVVRAQGEKAARILRAFSKLPFMERLFLRIFLRWQITCLEKRMFFYKRLTILQMEW